MKAIKSLILILLAVTMILSAVACDAFAPEDPDDEGAGTLEEWNAAWDALAASTNLTLEVRIVNEYFEGESGTVGTYGLEKLDGDRYYQFHASDNSVYEVCYARIDGADYRYYRSEDEAWKKYTIDYEVKYDMSQMAALAIKDSFSQFTYDEGTKTYNGTNVEVSIEVDGKTQSTVSDAIAVKIEGGRIVSIYNFGDVTRRGEGEAESTVIGKSASTFTFSNVGTTTATIPTEGSTESPDKPTDYELPSLDTDADGDRDGKTDGDDSTGGEEKPVVYDKTAVSADAWAAAFDLLRTPTRVTVNEETVYTYTDSRDVQVNGYKYLKTNENYKYDSGKHLRVVEYAYSQNGIVYETSGNPGDMPGRSEFDSYTAYYFEKLPNLGTVIDNYLAYTKSEPDELWKHGSDKELYVQAYGSEYVTLFSQLTFDAATGLYSGTQLTAGHPELGYGYTLDKVSVGFVGGKVHTIALTRHDTSRITETVYAYTDYGTTTVSVPGADEVYAGVTKAEWDSILGGASADKVFSVQFMEEVHYHDGREGESINLHITSSGNKMRVNDGSKDIEFYELSDGVLYRYYLVDDGKDGAWLKEECTNPPAYAPGEDGAGYWLAKFVGVYSDLSYNIENDEYSGDEVEGYDSDGLPVVYSRVIAKLATGSDRIYIEYHEEWFDNTGGDDVPVGMRDGTISYLEYAGYDELGFELPEVYEK